MNDTAAPDKADLLNNLVTELAAVRAEITQIVQNQYNLKILTLTVSGVLVPAATALFTSYESINNIISIHDIVSIPLIIVSVFLLSVTLSYNLLSYFKFSKTAFILDHLEPEIQKILGDGYRIFERDHTSRFNKPILGFRVRSYM